MGVLDRWIRRRGFVKPEEVKPVTKFKPVSVVRGFDAAKNDRLTYGFTTTPIHVNADMSRSWGALVARARELAKNDDYVRRFMRVARNNVLGPHGIKLQGRVHFPPGTDKAGQPDQAANEAIERAWKHWSMKGVCETTGRHSWREVQSLVIDAVMRDGEAFVQIIRGRGVNKFGTAVRLLDSASLPWDHSVDARGGANKIVMGVEMDARERPVAYHFRTTDSSNDGYYTHGGKGYVRIPATYPDGSPRVLHIYRAEEVGQVRGFTGLASAIMRLKMLSGYEEATLVAARVGASQMLFFERDENGENEYTGDDTMPDGSPVDEVEPGVARVLPMGWKASAFDPKQPTTGYTEFTKQTLRGIAAGLGLSYVTLANDLEAVNYSSARVGVLEDREEWKGVQAWVVESLCQPVYMQWLATSLLANQIVLTSGAVMPASRYENYTEVAWMPRRWDWVDPLKDMQANALALERGVRSISSIIRERGEDPDDVFEEIKRERERMKELDITLADAMPAHSTKEASNAESEEQPADA